MYCIFLQVQISSYQRLDSFREHKVVTFDKRLQNYVLKPKKNVFGKEYLCDCASCLQFDFKDCSNYNAVDNCEDDADLEEFLRGKRSN